MFMGFEEREECEEDELIFWVQVGKKIPGLKIMKGRTLMIYLLIDFWV